MANVKIFLVPFECRWSKDVPISIQEKGYLEVEKFDEEECWNLCNWSCWTDKKPENLHSDIEVAGSNIIFLNPENEKYYMAASVGWIVKDTLEEIESVARENQGKPIYLGENLDS
jgi:hypothetical protein